jgi:Rad3-related DNA helicase
MIDDLVKRLRCYADLNDAVFHPWIYGEAADRIEKLETNFQLQLEWYLSNKRFLDDRIEKLEAALRKIIDRAEFKNSEYVTDIVCRIAREALEGKDGK